MANRYFTTVCVRLLLESKEKKIREFIQGKINADRGLFLFLHSLCTNVGAKDTETSQHKEYWHRKTTLKTRFLEIISVLHMHKVKMK